MLPNLDAEQARTRKSDDVVAKMLNISRETYVRKKKTLNFKFREIIALCDYFHKDFDYLFATE